MASDLKNASAKNVSSMNYSNELSECSTMDSLCSFLRYKINNFCTADKVTFFKYEKEYLQGPNNLENKNIFPSIPKKTKFLFIPIIIDEEKKDLLIFSNNEFFDKWNGTQKRNH